MTSTVNSRPSTPPPPSPPKLYIVDEPSLAGTVQTFTDYDSKFKGKSDVAIVIDGGSWSTRAGFSTETNPRIAIPPVVSRYRDRKIGRTFTLVGHDAYADANSRGTSRFAYDMDVVSNFDVMENVLDFLFLKMGISDEGGIGHPVVMTEALCNPTYNRKSMTEMLFEGYNAPSVVYGIDSLFAYHHNNGQNGLVISSSNASTHAIPVLNGRGLVPLATRLNWGGSQGVDFLSKMLTLKYPGFPGKISSGQMEIMMKDYCYVSSDYKDEIASYLEPEVLDEKDRIVQFPFTEIVAVQKSEEELAKIAERRKESGRRLQEQAAKSRLEKLKKKEEELEYYRELLEKGQTMNKRDYKRALEGDGFKDEVQLEKVMKELEKKVRRSRNKDLGIEEEEEEVIPTFPLLDIPDEELDEEGIKQKKAQRLHKSGYEARQRARAEKEKERERLKDMEDKDEAYRLSDTEGWIRDKRTARDSILTKIKERQRIKAQLTDRKSVASQARMKAIAHLASDEPTRKRRRGNDEDTFGADDDDWAIYRNISTAANEDDEEEEEEMATELKLLEDALLKHDPAFGLEHTQAAMEGGDWSKSLIHHFLRGTRKFDSEDQAMANQMHLNIERIRVPEVIFEPSMAGVDQAGIVELTSDILLHRLPNPADREKAYRDIFVTGGNCMFEGFQERLKRELRAVLPFEAAMDVRRAKDPLLDAWRGAAKWAGSAEWKKTAVTKAEYMEKGSEYMKENRLGNGLSY